MSNSKEDVGTGNQSELIDGMLPASLLPRLCKLIFDLTEKGEGLKYAAKAKSGVGVFLFKDTKPNKTKKFGYKKRAQTFPIRKVTTAQDSEAENRPAPQKKAAPDKTSQKSRTTSARETDPKTSGKPTTGRDQDNKPSRKDFVKRNAQKVSGKAKDGPKDVNTIALTQDQLNAILKSIGHVAGSEKVASVAVENGDVKVNAPETETSEDKQEEPNKGATPDKKKDADDTKKGDYDKTSTPEGSENILTLLAKAEARTPSPVPSTKPMTPSKTPASVANTEASSKSPKKGSEDKTAGRNRHKSKDEGKSRAKKDDTSQKEPKETEDSGQVELANLTLAERKRRKWKQEQDEQIALQKQQAAQERHVREVIASRMGMTYHQDTSSQGQQERRAAPSRNAYEVDDVRTSKENFSPDTSPRHVAPSSLGVLATQHVAPAAMRTSFLIGGQGSAGSRLSDYNEQVKRRQQQEWLQELEQQRIEAQKRKERERQRQREFESNLTQQWAEPVDPPKTRAPARGQPQVQDDTAVTRQTDRESNRRGEVEQPRSAPPQGAEVGGEVGSLEEGPQGRSHIRAHNLLLDPAELERREAQRIKHMEHMLAVKAQVEEKQRLKREADERRRQEEAEEESRLAQQRMTLQQQFDMEKDKQKKKEEEEAARHRALVESVQMAYQEAQQEKHQKRLDKLAKMGHDTSNLRRSWDNQPDISPRHQPNTQASYKVSPRAEQPAMPQPVRHSPVVPVAHHVTSHVTSHAMEGPLMVDAFTSPVYDQAVQTEFHFTPHEDVSLQSGRFEREPSAHIEYKPDRNQVNNEQQRNRKSDQSRTGKAQERKMRTVKEESQQDNVRGTRGTQRTSRASSPGSELDYTNKRAGGKSEKPVWGAGTKNKKVQRNSDKDLTVSRRKRAERRKQRAAELLADQERNAPGRLTKAKRPKSPTGDTQQANSILESKTTRSRAGSNLDKNPNVESHRVRAESFTDRAGSQVQRDVNSNLPDTPPLKNGDFVPFLRSDDPLMSEDSVPVTPESRQMQRQRKAVKTVVADDSDRQKKEEIRKLPTQTVKDPLLNPDRLRDTEQRQERILQQLSHLRQGLMMKQREMELGLNSPVLM